MGMAVSSQSIESLSIMINRFFDKLIEKYHNFLTWQQVVKCQECGKVIGVCGVYYGHESDLDEKLR